MFSYTFELKKQLFNIACMCFLPVQADTCVSERQPGRISSHVCLSGLWRVTDTAHQLDKAGIIQAVNGEPAGPHQDNLQRHVHMWQLCQCSHNANDRMLSTSCGMHAEAAHHFSAQANDWGFTAFANQQDIFAPNAGFLVNDTLRMNVVVRVERPEDLYYDSKKSTGYVGLKNQGATCYMNSLLQTLYNINYFRQVYLMFTPPALRHELVCMLLPSCCCHSS